MSSNPPPGPPDRFPGRKPPPKPPTLLDWLRRARNWITIGILIVLNYLVVNVLLAPEPPKHAQRETDRDTDRPELPGRPRAPGAAAAEAGHDPLQRLQGSDNRQQRD